MTNPLRTETKVENTTTVSPRIRKTEKPFPSAHAPAQARWVYDDGGRKDAGYKGTAGDCVTRAIAIAAERPYQEVYDEIGQLIGEWSKGRSRAAQRWRTRSRGATGRNGTPKAVIRSYLESISWKWTPTMQIGSGTTVHLRASELPPGRIIAKVSGHLTAMIDGVVHDTHDPSRAGTRCVYGYYEKED